MKHLVKFLTVVEIEVDTEEMHDPAEEAQVKLDAFREATLPSENYGVTLYRATPEDLRGDLLRRRSNCFRYSGRTRRTISFEVPSSAFASFSGRSAASSFQHFAGPLQLRGERLLAR